MEGLRCEVRTVRPYHRAADWIEMDSREEVGVREGLEDRALEQRTDVDDLGSAVVEVDIELVGAASDRSGHPEDHRGTYSRGSTGFSGIDRRASCQFSASASRWVSHHSATSRDARLGIVPWRSEAVRDRGSTCRSRFRRTVRCGASRCGLRENEVRTLACPVNLCIAGSGWNRDSGPY